MSGNPYENAPDTRFWRFGVAAATSSAPEGLYERKWAISKTDRVATAGSCFAQHIGRNLRNSQFTVMDVEPPPPALPAAEHNRFGYQIYSGRYGNVYTARQLLQLAREAFEELEPADAIWTKNGRYYDAFRPSVEPHGLDSPEEVQAHRRHHLARVRHMFSTMDVFVFTLGLTECWIHRETGTVFPTVPGSIAGTFDADTYAFHNFSYDEIRADLLAFRELMHKVRGHDKLRILLTVSPVPLTATAAGRHVLQATVYSKSVLRAVAGSLEADFADIDYFPSFEIITNPWSADDFFEPNRRSVAAHGVALVMKTFLAAHDVDARPAPGAADILPFRSDAAARPAPPPKPDAAADDDAKMALVCDEELLEAFSKGRR